MDLECSTVDDICMDKQNTALHSDFIVHGNISFLAAAVKQHKNNIKWKGLTFASTSRGDEVRHCGKDMTLDF